MFHNTSSTLLSSMEHIPWHSLHSLGTDSLWTSLDYFARSFPPETSVDAPFVLTPSTVAAMLLTFLCGLLANAGGVGGGPFFIPTFMTLLDFDLKTSTALSITVVASGALASTIYGVHKTSPRDPDRTLLDFDLAVTFLPALLLGVNFGVLFNVLIPQWLQTFLLVFALIFVIRNTASKARRQWELEQNTLTRTCSKPPVIPELAISSLQQPLLNGPNDVTCGTFPQNSAVVSRETREDGEERPRGVSESGTFSPPEKKKGTKTLVQRIPFGQLSGLLVLWVVFLVSQGEKTRYPRCSMVHLSIWGVQVLVLLLLGGWQIWHQVQKARSDAEDLDPEIRVILSHGNLDGGFREPIKILFRVGCVMAFAGIGAGLLGVGGAVFFNPSLLHMGVHPQVTASTAVLMILFSSSSISLSLAFHNLLNYHYALVFAPISFVASTIGVTLVGRIVRQSGRTSIIVIILTALVTAGTVTTAVFGGFRSYHEFLKGEDVGFHPFCGK